MSAEDRLYHAIGVIIGLALWSAYWFSFGSMFAPHP